MKHRFYLLLITVFFAFGVAAQEMEYENNNGLFAEILPDTTDLARYNRDNVVYTPESVFTFGYYFEKAGEKYHFQTIQAANGAIYKWDFIPHEALSDSAVTTFQIKVLPDLSSYAHFPGYNQTIIEYTYYMNNGGKCNLTSSTGVIENAKNIWMHPPRSLLFRILELNPFPFIQAPYEKGNAWTWSLKIGDSWSDSRWKEWEGVIENQYFYEITEENVPIPTPLGELRCYKIDSRAESELGKTYLTAYFHEKYGFVKWDYTNIDGSRIFIELKEVKRGGDK